MVMLYEHSHKFKLFFMLWSDFHKYIDFIFVHALEV